MPQKRNDEPGAREEAQKNAAAAIAIAAAAGVHAPPGVEARFNSKSHRSRLYWAACRCLWCLCLPWCLPFLPCLPLAPAWPCRAETPEPEDVSPAGPAHAAPDTSIIAANAATEKRDRFMPDSQRIPIPIATPLRVLARNGPHSESSNAWVSDLLLSLARNAPSSQGG
jgi:hypothetical protein